MLIAEGLTRSECKTCEVYSDIALVRGQLQVANRRFAQVRHRKGIARYLEPVDERNWRRLEAIRLGDEPRNPGVRAEPERPLAVAKAAYHLIIGQSVRGCEMPDAPCRRIQPVQAVISRSVEAAPLVLTNAPHPVACKPFGDCVNNGRRALRRRVVNTSKAPLAERNPEPPFAIHEQASEYPCRKPVGGSEELEAVFRVADQP